MNASWKPCGCIIWLNYIIYIVNLSESMMAAMQLNNLTFLKYATKYFNETNLNGHFWIITAKQSSSTFVVCSCRISQMYFLPLISVHSRKKKINKK